MTYSIFDSTGNLVDAFDDRDARPALSTRVERKRRRTPPPP
jgi:hypothetical protein